MRFFHDFINKLFPKADDSHEFKPILAEIEDAPLNPIGNTMFWVIIIFMLIAGLWMYFGKVDIVVTARGIIIPTGEEKLVQSLEKGVLTTLAVKEGEYVTEGQLVAIVSPAEYEPELELNNLREEEARISQQMASDPLPAAKKQGWNLSEILFRVQGMTKAQKKLPNYPMKSHLWVHL